ncbi:uncharacterized protein BXZ73DRAFT_12267, partial [Epithele typhae]|uniref:uncharacterized protein n=1 Tax=Epithele typhae TaxID=378194 RepID=UPI00200820A4
WNSTLSINRLPHEILSDIFAAIPRPPEFLEKYVEPRGWRERLMLVCREWRDTIVGTPTLWSLLCVSSTMSIDCLSLRLARSANADLRLYFLTGYHHIWTDEGLGVLRLVVAHSKRVRSMVLPCLSPSLCTLLEDNTWPLLTHMHISNPPRRDSDLHLKHLRFPELDHLSLAGSRLSLDPHLFRVIKWLKLSSDRTWSPDEFFAKYSGTSSLQLKELII